MQNKQTNDADAQTSKFLSYVLRHKPEAIGLSLDCEGWAEVEALLRLAATHGNEIPHEQFMRIVAQSDKKRFTLSADGLYIRAAQGHSTDQVNIDFSLRNPPETLFHGTAERFLESILATGLVPGERQYVHLSSEHKTAMKVGQRHGKPVVFTVLAEKMNKDGFLFYLSENDVWLTRNVPPVYFVW